MKYTTHSNFKPREEHFEKNEGKSQTIQEDTYTIKDFVKKSTSGMIDINDLTRRGQYAEAEPSHDDYDLSLLSRQDRVDRDNALLENSEFIRGVNEMASREKASLNAVNEVDSSKPNDGETVSEVTSPAKQDKNPLPEGV